MSTPPPYSTQHSTSFVTSTRVPLDGTTDAIGAGTAATTLATYASSVIYNASTAASQVIREEQCTFQKWAQQPDQPGFFRTFVIISVLTILVVLVVLGNALVIAAVIMRRRLRSATGLLILSLAVADLMVGLVILPFSIANEVLSSYWIFGDIWCTIWLTMDIWMCTASIYNLVAISIDRYIAIIKPLNYPMLITKFRARCIVAAVWIGSFIICSPSFLLASSDKDQIATVSEKEKCRCTPANSGMAYIVFSASSSFYIPMIVVIFVYARIYVAACAATKSVYSGMMQVTATANKNPKNILMQNPSALSRGTQQVPVLRVHRGSTVKNMNAGVELERNTKPKPMSVPVSINGSTPTVYAQMNGSSNSLQYVKRSPGLRRRSDEDKLQMHELGTPGARHRHSRSPSRRGTTGSIHAMCNDSAHSITALKGSSPRIDDLGSAGLERPASMLSISEQEKQKWFNGASANPMQRIKEQLSVESDTPPNGDSSRYNLLADSQAKDAHNGCCRDDHEIPEDPRPESRGASADTAKAIMVNAATATDDQSKMAFLHPDSAKRPKKRHYGAGVLNRIMRRTPRKKAACAYEKKLSLEIKAAKTVAIVTGCFIFCWLAFSIVYGFSIQTNEVVWSLVFWLGYLNSALNPVIYTVFNREFRTCFKKLLTCNHMIFNTRVTAPNAYSYNSHRPGHHVGNSSVSVPSYLPTRSSPPFGNNSNES